MLVGAADVAALQWVLVDSGVGSEADVDRAREVAGSFGLFLRRLFGFDRAAPRDAFARFLGSAQAAPPARSEKVTASGLRRSPVGCDQVPVTMPSLCAAASAGWRGGTGRPELSSTQPRWSVKMMPSRSLAFPVMPKWPRWCSR